ENKSENVGLFIDKSHPVWRIENDIKRQLFVLEQIEKNGIEKMLDLKQEVVKKKIMEREDLLVKKRLSNSVAMAALGQKKLWSTEKKEKTKKPQFLSIYSPYNEKEIEKKINQRKIILEDYIFIMERDKRYNKSIFIIKEYFKRSNLLP
ncbi:TATA box binding protein (TBP)-associated factor, RNA polymerase II, partial [Pseudoloma neurophilia]